MSAQLTVEPPTSSIRMLFTHASHAASQPASPAPTAKPTILEAVNLRLRDSSYYYLRCISCAYDEGVLTLRGRVPTFYLKQTAQALAGKVDGVRQIINLVDVVNPA